MAYTDEPAPLPELDQDHDGPLPAQAKRVSPISGTAPPGTKGLKLAETRRYSTQQLLKIAKTKNAFILVPDFWVTRRKRRHMLFDADGNPVLYSQNLEEVIEVMRHRDVANLIIETAYLPKPAFCVMHTKAQPMRKRDTHG